MIDLDRESPVERLSLYLTPQAAEWLRNELDALLKDPEAWTHFHVLAEDTGRELSCSIITKSKLSEIHRYNKLEQRILSEA